MESKDIDDEEDPMDMRRGFLGFLPFFLLIRQEDGDDEDEDP